MEFNLLEGVMEYGLVGGAFLFMLWQAYRRESRLMDFIDGMKDELKKISESLILLKDDVNEIKHKEKGE